MKNRVCHITSAHSRYDVRIFQKECRSLAKSGYEVYLVVNDNQDNEIVDGVHIISLHMKYNSRFQRMLKVGRGIYLKALAVDASIYHIHDPELLPYAVKLLNKGKEVIFDSHEFYAEQILLKEYIPKRCRQLISILYKKYEEFVVKRITGVIVPCLYDGRDYFKGKFQRQAIINNVPLLSEIPNELYHLEKNSKQVCYVGTLSKDRGLHTMIRASIMADVKLVLAGRLYSEDLEKKLTNSKKNAKVFYCGNVSHEEAYRIISESNIGLCLLLGEGQYCKACNLSTKIYEYMALGVPVIASDFPYFKEILEKEKCGICVDPKNISAISEAMKELMKDPLMREQMGQKGQELIRERFCWEKEEKNLLKFYEEIAFEVSERKKRK